MLAWCTFHLYDMRLSMYQGHEWLEHPRTRVGWSQHLTSKIYNWQTYKFPLACLLLVWGFSALYLSKLEIASPGPKSKKEQTIATTLSSTNRVIIAPPITPNNFWGFNMRNPQEELHLLVLSLLGRSIPPITPKYSQRINWRNKFHLCYTRKFSAN